MTLWFLRGIRRGVVTTRYPARPDEFAEYLPTPPVFRPDALTKQEADHLAAVCPSRALARGQDVLVYDVGRCTACGRCAAEAPSAAAPSHVWELATRDRSALIKEIPLRRESR
jgi:ferredoxin